ncbi:MAG: hypothetical protein EA401_06485 [Planctomycetota bacterium]|nr:MAG: hypothetical protein EA401_06485 [Planctomycetota bacterium]
MADDYQTMLLDVMLKNNEELIHHSNADIKIGGRQLTSLRGVSDPPFGLFRRKQFLRSSAFLAAK